MIVATLVKEQIRASRGMCLDVFTGKIKVSVPDFRVEALLNVIDDIQDSRQILFKCK